MNITVYAPTKSDIIKYHFTETLFGKCLVAHCDDGICEVLFVDGSEQNAIAELRSQWQEASIVEDDTTYGDSHCSADLIAADTENSYSILLSGKENCTLCLKGTPFQREVWALLTEIPYGTTVTYSDIAARLGRPQAVRAVATAIASNKIALLIPCHRVIRSDGSNSGYRWGCDRKLEILKREKAANNTSKIK